MQAESRARQLEEHARTAEERARALEERSRELEDRAQLFERQAASTQAELEEMGRHIAERALDGDERDGDARTPAGRAGSDRPASRARGRADPAVDGAPRAGEHEGPSRTSPRTPRAISTRSTSRRSARARPPRTRRPSSSSARRSWTTCATRSVRCGPRSSAPRCSRTSSAPPKAELQSLSASHRADLDRTRGRARGEGPRDARGVPGRAHAPSSRRTASRWPSESCSCPSASRGPRTRRRSGWTPPSASSPSEPSGSNAPRMRSRRPPPRHSTSAAS